MDVEFQVWEACCEGYGDETAGAVNVNNCSAIDRGRGGSGGYVGGYAGRCLVDDSISDCVLEGTVGVELAKTNFLADFNKGTRCSWGKLVLFHR